MIWQDFKLYNGITLRTLEDFNPSQGMQTLFDFKFKFERPNQTLDR